MRVIWYRRVSTDEQSESGLGLAAQMAVVQEEMGRRPGWTTVEDVVDEGYSAKAKSIDSRPGLVRARAMLSCGDADVLLAAKLDRLTRSVADLAALMDDASRQGWSLVAVDNRDVDMTTATGRLFANIMSSVSQWEREVVAERTSHALQELKRRGVRLGRPVALAPEVRQRIARLREEGVSLGRIAALLNSEAVPTARGGRWYSSTIAATLRSLELDRDARAAAESG